jgi:PilZ domain
MRRLAEFSVVTVNPPWRGALRSDSFECYVLAVVDETAAIQPVDVSSTLWLPEQMDRALLSFRHKGALVGLCGTLTVLDIGDLRYTVSDGIQAPGRRATRIDVCAPVMLRRAGSADVVAGQAVNISANGILVESELDLVAGDAVEVVLTLGGVAEPIEAMARVARITGDGCAGIELDPQNRAARSRLATFVVEHNRAVLLRGPQVGVALKF